MPDEANGYFRIEQKVRHVIDSAYWGLPKGTPIVPGMKPQGIVPKARSLKASVAKDSVRVSAKKNPVTRTIHVTPPAPAKEDASRVQEHWVNNRPRASDLRFGDMIDDKRIEKVKINHDENSVDVSFDDGSNTSFSRNQTVPVRRLKTARGKKNVKNNDKFQDSTGRPLRVGDRVQLPNALDTVAVVQYIDESGALSVVTDVANQKHAFATRIEDPSSVKVIRRGKPVVGYQKGRSYLKDFFETNPTQANAFSINNATHMFVEGRWRVGINKWHFEIQHRRDASAQKAGGWYTVETGSARAGKLGDIEMSAKRAREALITVREEDAARKAKRDFDIPSFDKNEVSPVTEDAISRVEKARTTHGRKLVRGSVNLPSARSKAAKDFIAALNDSLTGTKWLDTGMEVDDTSGKVTIYNKDKAKRHMTKVRRVLANDEKALAFAKRFSDGI